MSPSKPVTGVKRAGPTASPSTSANANGKTDGTSSKRQKRDGHATGNDYASTSTPTPAAAAAAAAESNHGSSLMTNLTYAVEFLKGKGTAKSLQAILDHLTLQHAPPEQQKRFAQAMQQFARIQWNMPPKAKVTDWQVGTYEFRPLLPGVTSKDTLLEYLQSRKDAGATEVKNIKDGWPGCEQALLELEKEHKILTVRTKKEQTPRYVWLDNPDLHHHVDDEFRAMWFKEPLPSADEMPRKLKALGQKATSGDSNKNANAGQKAPPKRKKAARVQKKFENEHMRNIFDQHKRK
ncbi:hypothetical protein F5Y05DRAFT_263751 [Hypoxylon sp. FL0543]|nr:hypothetical protein F5Y05DRAFT_263751 [Hypoxylon sp. FL0543]